MKKKKTFSRHFYFIIYRQPVAVSKTTSRDICGGRAPWNRAGNLTCQQNRQMLSTQVTLQRAIKQIRRLPAVFTFTSCRNDQRAQNK